jgi:hypothetical protein
LIATDWDALAYHPDVFNDTVRVADRSFRRADLRFWVCFMVVFALATHAPLQFPGVR